MQAIETKFLGPTNTRGARIVARTANGQKITVPFDHASRTGIDAHAPAAYALARKMGWGGDWFGGTLENSYVFVASNYDGSPLRMLDGGRVLAEAQS